MGQSGAVNELATSTVCGYTPPMSPFTIPAIPTPRSNAYALAVMVATIIGNGYVKRGFPLNVSNITFFCTVRVILHGATLI